MEARKFVNSYPAHIDQTAEKDELAAELFDEINEMITTLVAALNTSK